MSLINRFNDNLSINLSSSESDLKILLLENNLDLMDQLLKLLNSEWPRSTVARLRSLEKKSAGKFPVSLLLVKIYENGDKEVIGHSKILSIPTQPNYSVIESVIISSKHRGKGFGKLIMKESEEFIKKAGIQNVYLTTHDKEEFYLKLGYHYSQPLLFSQSTQLMESNSSMRVLHEKLLKNLNSEGKQIEKNAVEPNLSSNLVRVENFNSSTPPPPLPPPLPLNSVYNKTNLNIKYMRKVLDL